MKEPGPRGPVCSTFMSTGLLPVGRCLLRASYDTGSSPSVLSSLAQSAKKIKGRIEQRVQVCVFAGYACMCVCVCVCGHAAKQVRRSSERERERKGKVASKLWALQLLLHPFCQLSIGVALWPLFVRNRITSSSPLCPMAKSGHKLVMWNVQRTKRGDKQEKEHGDHTLASKSGRLSEKLPPCDSAAWFGPGPRINDFGGMFV